MDIPLVEPIMPASPWPPSRTFHPESLLEAAGGVSAASNTRGGCPAHSPKHFHQSRGRWCTAGFLSSKRAVALLLRSGGGTRSTASFCRSGRSAATLLAHWARPSCRTARTSGALRVAVGAVYCSVAILRLGRRRARAAARPPPGCPGPWLRAVRLGLLVCPSTAAADAAAAAASSTSGACDSSASDAARAAAPACPAATPASATAGAAAAPSAPAAVGAIRSVGDGRRHACRRVGRRSRRQRLGL
mmetsp:Transcript_38600/g.90254  ORF Transcript_38600/g.90254 Transcript_38600/m.90254 type:complete len:246 (-) Transcript_38600:1420-2157(-)